MGLIFLYSVYQLFVKGFDKDELETDHPKSLSNLVRYLLFGTINSFFAGRFFEIDWLNWIAFYSILGIIICLKSEKEDKKQFFQRLIIAFVAFILFSMYRVPTHPQSFEKYINSKEMYRCVTRFECVKITPVVTNQNVLKTKVEILSINGYSFKWYLLFAKSGIQLADDKGNIEEIKGINICGYWIEY